MSALRWCVLLAAATTLAACQAPTRPTPPAEIVATAPAADSIPTVSPPRKRKRAPAVVEPAPAPEPLPQPLRGADVFERLVARLADPPCVQDRVVQRWERVYGRWPPRLHSSLEAVLPLMALVLDEIETHHLPAEFVLLPIVESWYRPDAGSPRVAYGMWQFTTATARNQGLAIVPGFDERLAPQASTRAAMRYLAILQNRFGDWKLADMAFNAGEYRLQRVLAKQKGDTRVSAAAHRPAGLSMTTYEHVAKIQALACLIAQPRRFGVELPLATPIEPLVVVELPRGVDTLDAAATRAAIPRATLAALNPAFLRGRVVAAAPRNVLLPQRAASRLLAAPGSPDVHPHAAATSAQAASDSTLTRYRVRPGDTLGAIASRHRVSLADLLRWNRLDVRALLHPGQWLRLEP